MRIDRRPAAESDRAFLFELYASTRAQELAMVPWNEEQKRAFVEAQFAAQARGYQDSFPHATHEILTRDGVDVGRLYLTREIDNIQILDITIAAQARNEGIGAQVLAEIAAEADRNLQSASIYVETFNPSRSLFERLGFRKISEDGFMLLLRRPASSVAASGSGSSKAAG